MTAATDKDSPTFSDEVISQEAGNLMVAGNDTTANMLTYILWRVTKRPDIIRQGEEEVAALKDSELSDARLAELPLLDAVIKRLFDCTP